MDRLRTVVASNPILALTVLASLAAVPLYLHLKWNFVAGMYLALALQKTAELADEWIRLTRLDRLTPPKRTP